jgi:uncharacterized membrane protein
VYGIITLVAVVLILGFLAALIILPILAYLRSGRALALSQRVDDLEDEVRRLRRQLRRRPVEEPAEPAREEPVPEAQPAEVLPAEEPQPAPRRRILPPADAISLEDWIGRRGLGWAAVVLLLFATAFFLKYAFENNWIGELGRVSIGIVAGTVLCVAGWRVLHRGYPIFSQMVTAAGVVLLYLSTFASFGYYHLMPREWGAVFLILLVAETAGLALLYDAPAIALMAVIGGLLNPILLHTDHDQYRSLFTYLLILNLGVVALALFRAWPAVATVALAGTQALFWAWWFENYHPEKLEAALLFQSALFGLYLLHNLFAHVLRRRNADIEALGRTALNAFLFALAGYFLLREDYHDWLGTAAVGLAILYTALAWFVMRRRPDDTRQQLVLVATALACVAVVFPLQTSAAWIALGWAVEGAALSWFGLRIDSVRLRGLGGALLVLGAGKLLLVDTPALDRTEPFVPIFNNYAVPALAIAACVLFAAVASRRLLRRPTEGEYALRIVEGLAGVLLVWLILSIETYQTFSVTLGMRGDADWFARTSLSVLWPIYAAILLAIGFKLDSAALRWTALGLFALTLCKVVFVDMADLPGFYRVAAFFVLSVILGAAAWGYQKIERQRRLDRQREVDHANA